MEYVNLGKSIKNKSYKQLFNSISGNTELYLLKKNTNMNDIFIMKVKKGKSE